MTDDISLDSIRDILDYNKILRDCDTKEGKERVYGDECVGSELRKVVLYNIRYDQDKNTRSDIDILDEYNILSRANDTINLLVEKRRSDLHDLDNPSTIERLSRTLITWTWSDDPRKNRIQLRKEINKEIKDMELLLEDIEFQIPLYRSLVSVTTTLKIKVKSSKLKPKYAKKIKKHK
jgi:hypothetical protein